MMRNSGHSADSYTRLCWSIIAAAISASRSVASCTADTRRWEVKTKTAVAELAVRNVLNNDASAQAAFREKAALRMQQNNKSAQRTCAMALMSGPMSDCIKVTSRIFIGPSMMHASMSRMPWMPADVGTGKPGGKDAALPSARTSEEQHDIRGQARGMPARDQSSTQADFGNSPAADCCVPCGAPFEPSSGVRPKSSWRTVIFHICSGRNSPVVFWSSLSARRRHARGTTSGRGPPGLRNSLNLATWKSLPARGRSSGGRR